MVPCISVSLINCGVWTPPKPLFDRSELRAMLKLPKRLCKC